jgi:hypothetical protein
MRTNASYNSDILSATTESRVEPDAGASRRRTSVAQHWQGRSRSVLRQMNDAPMIKPDQTKKVHRSGLEEWFKAGFVSAGISVSSLFKPSGFASAAPTPRLPV